ncbi:MAG: pyruvate, phosphate dikinase, partial [Clostridia bacterium]|nr:pyruvate, phosphate dikinase [Clostridia bacterium]
MAVGTLRKLVYAFEEGNASMRDLLGGKGASLAEMTSIGLPVPPGFTVTTEACNLYAAAGRRFPEGLEAAVLSALEELERKMGRRFGDPERPLLVSVRSGAKISMPGMMDTVLNLGLNDRTVEGLARQTGDRRFALDCYRRFIQMFGDVVLRIPSATFEAILEEEKRREGVRGDHELPAAALERVVERYRAAVEEACGRPFPQEPNEQLFLAIRAVFDSWNNDRAVVYRRLHRIPDDLGTAVNVQAMVFGNLGEDSGTGVMFTRDPSTGEPVLYGEYLPNAQGEDVVAGVRTPLPLSQLEETQPQLYAELERVAALLEDHYRDVQDIEFTVERGRLYLLQCRTAKRTARAAVKTAHDFCVEGRISRREALLRVDPAEVVRLLHRNVDQVAAPEPIAVGLPASPGAATGEIVFDADEAERLGLEGRAVLLVRTETTPDDIHGIVQARGVLTSRGGMTCHAAVVARGMGKPCVVGCEALQIDPVARVVAVGDRVFRAGDVLTIDGASGSVYAGPVPLVEPDFIPEFQELLACDDDVRRRVVRANADTPEDAELARRFGATGIGLCRTEHMFMAQDRLPVVQAMILAETPAERAAALERLLPMQQRDFEGILSAMEGYPVIIRLLDPPLHEFLPDIRELLVEVTRLRLTGDDPERLAEAERLLRRVRALWEANPMLGLRGCRLGVLYPEIYEMQCRAIFRAAAKLTAAGRRVFPEVMVPLVGSAAEMALMRSLVDRVADEVMEATGVTLHYHVGTMI